MFSKDISKYISYLFSIISFLSMFYMNKKWAENITLCICESISDARNQRIQQQHTYYRCAFLPGMNKKAHQSSFLIIVERTRQRMCGLKCPKNRLFAYKF